MITALNKFNIQMLPMHDMTVDFASQGRVSLWPNG